MRTLRKLSSAGAMLCLLSLFAPLAAGARPPQSAGLLAPLPSFSALRPSIAGPHLLVTRLSSAPAHARAGHDYVLRGMVVNEGSAAVRGRVVVHLLHVGTRPLAVGRTAVRLAAHDSSSFRVRMRLPRFLNEGSYAVVACARRGGQSGNLGCITAERHIAVGTVARASAVRASIAAPSQPCSSGAHSLSPFGAHVYPETGNGGYTSMHTDVFLDYDAESEPVSAGDARRPDRPRDAVPDRLQPRLRADVGERHGRPEHDRRSVLVNGQPASFTFVQPTYPGDPNGQNDPDPAGAPGRRSSTRSAARRTTRCRPRARPSCSTGEPASTRWTARRARRTSS